MSDESELSEWTHCETQIRVILPDGQRNGSTARDRFETTKRQTISTLVPDLNLEDIGLDSLANMEECSETDKVTLAYSGSTAQGDGSGNGVRDELLKGGGNGFAWRI